jgi:SAM-dependent methyltransferase
MLYLFMILGSIALVSVLLMAVLTAVHYPGHRDLEPVHSAKDAPRDFYEVAYTESSEPAAVATRDEEYGQSARDHAVRAGIPQLLKRFVETNGLTGARALEVGCGSGLLQETVQRYVGVDLSFSARRFFHKPFVQASATAIPFGNNSFDAVWSIWVLEHVPNPEQALQEIRRVVKDKGYVLLRPAWNVDSWASQGYEVRPYSDFGIGGKLIKASIPIRLSRWYALFHTRQIRILRTLLTALSDKPSHLGYSRLQPNYEKFWVTDSDAAVSLDPYEVYLWFKSRGDECLNCPAQWELLVGGSGGLTENLVIRVNKPRE